MIDEPRAEHLRRLSHDLRSPLSVLKGTLEQLPSLQRAEREVALQRAGRAVDRLLRLAEHLGLSGRASQGFTVVPQTVDVKAATNAALEAVQRAEPRSRIITEVRGEGSWPTDPGLLRALLEEVDSNGLKNASSKLSLEVGPEAVAVEDDGLGIEPARAAAVFDHPVTTRQGLGLGLPLAHAIARALHLRLLLVPAATGALARFELRR
jgi:signal transduction histidine kinase